MMGLSGIVNAPFLKSIFWPSAGTGRLLYVGIEFLLYYDAVLPCVDLGGVDAGNFTYRVDGLQIAVRFAILDDGGRIFLGSVERVHQLVSFGLVHIDQHVVPG